MNQGNSRKILIVEDEAELREIIVFDFESAGYQVLEADSAKSAVEAMDKNSFGAIVSDIRMSNGDGIQLLRSIQEAKVTADLALVFITGYSDFSIQDALDQGASGFLLKPFNRRKLISVIEKLLIPIELRWADAPSANGRKPPMDLKLNFENFERARKEKALGFGRGGFFVAASTDLPKVDDNIKFEFSFSDGAVPALKGEASVIWVRNENSLEEPVGFGMEICFLESPSLRWMKGFLEAQRFLAYIPKS